MNGYRQFSATWISIVVFVLLFTACGALNCGSWFGEPYSQAFKNKTEEKAFIDSKLDGITVNSAPSNLFCNRVSVMLKFYQIVDVDEKEGILSTKILLQYSYTVPGIAWERYDVNLIYFAGKWCPKVATLA